LAYCDRTLYHWQEAGLAFPSMDEPRMLDILRRLQDDSQLHKLLSDERMRCQVKTL
jgi:hypothetical protein